MPQPCSGRRGDAPAEECRSPRRKRPRLERPSRQEVDFLRTKVEQLKALLKAPEPTPAFQAAAAWESGEDLEDDGISVRASNSEFQSLEDQRDPFPDPRDRDGNPPSIGGNDGSGNSLGSSVSSGPGEEPCPLWAIILAALAKVDLDDAPVARPMGNPFFRRAPAAPPFERPREHWSAVGSPARPLRLGVVATGPWDPLLRNPGDVTYGTRGISFGPPLPHSLCSRVALWRGLVAARGGTGTTSRGSGGPGQEPAPPRGRSRRQRAA
ncbi:hypothetical protein XENOCAPTIV_004691 [Xenoophorus captivus]|uniref:Uncharacterized protein n=1 Tax=Xenoophorus captivus TaxID=1517983 RepID=A0ABV0QGH0_9TELE